MKRRFAAALLAALSFVGLINTVPAGAATQLHALSYGCNTTLYHYRFEDIGWRENNGHQHKGFYFHIFSRRDGRLLHQNAFFADAPWHAYVYQVDSDNPARCNFKIGVWPGLGFDMIQAEYWWASGFESNGVWDNRMSSSGAWINYGNWGDAGATVRVINNSGGTVTIEGLDH